MDLFPLSGNQGAIDSADVSSPSPNESIVLAVSRSPPCSHVNSPPACHVSRPPACDVGRWGTRSTDELSNAVLEREQPGSFSHRAYCYAQSPACQGLQFFQDQETGCSVVPTDAADSFGFYLNSFASHFQTKNDASLACSGRNSSRSDCPLLKSLLMWGHSSGDKSVEAEHPVASQREEAASCTVFRQSQYGADPGQQSSASEKNCACVVAAVQASRDASLHIRRRLNSHDLLEIQKVTRIFRRAMRMPLCCLVQRFSSTSSRVLSFNGLRHLALHARSSAVRALRFACHLPQFCRKPPRVQVALIKSASAGCMVLQLAQSYNSERGCWLDSHGNSFRPQDLVRLVPSSTCPELWNDVAAVGVALNSLVRPGCDGVDGNNDDLRARFFSLLHAVLIMSPENVPCLRERDCDIAAAVSDCQQSFIRLLRRHLESSLSVARAAKLLPTLLMHLVAIRSLAMSVRIALLSERMVRRDRVLVDALSLELAMW